MQITKAVVPAGGRGTRLYPVTKSQPKEMLPLGTKPTIQGVAEEVVAAGISDILIITGDAKRAVEDHFDPGNGLSAEDVGGRTRPLFDYSRVKFYYSRQGKPRGLGDAVLCGERFVGEEHFIVALGDCLITGPEPAGPLRRMVAAHIECEADISIIVQQVDAEATKRYGIVRPGADMGAHAFAMEDIIEKPGPARAPSRYAVAARYIFSPAIFQYLAELTPGVGSEMQLTDAIRQMVADGHRALAVPLEASERRLDVGNFTGYSKAFFRTMLTHEEYGEGLRSYAAKLLAHLRDPTNPDPDLPADP